MQYMVLINDLEAWEGLNADEKEALYARIGAWWGERAAKGEIREGHELQGAETATTVRRRARGKALVTDGPYIDAKESIGGYAVIDVTDLNAAIELASSWPVPGTLEIRPIVSDPS
jgi:hypothetical protein